MEDNAIIQLYWDRNEKAIDETEKKYGSYCSTIAGNILFNREDTMECVNDTYLRTWNTIPTERPKFFPAYIGKIVRNLAINLYNRNTALKRGGGQTSVILDELEECIPDRAAELEYDENELVEAINCFLSTLKTKHRRVFMMRYWGNASIENIAGSMNMTEDSVYVMLSRIRNKLKKYLEERGIKI